VRRPVDTFFTEDETTARAPPKVFGLVVIEIKGAKSGEKLECKISYPVTLFATPEERLELYRRFGATNIGVALPAIVGAKMCVQGLAKKGVISSECLNPIKFLKMMAEMGVPEKFNEELSKEVSIS